jgi:hypothetical protein
MTRKDYVLIAETVRRMFLETDNVEYIQRQLAEDFAEKLQMTNDRFDRQRFLTACGVK